MDDRIGKCSQEVNNFFRSRSSPTAFSTGMALKEGRTQRNRWRWKGFGVGVRSAHPWMYSQGFELLFHLYHISPLFSRMAHNEVRCEPDLSFQLSVMELKRLTKDSRL